VINIDGRVPDEGSLVEATLAWYAGHPVVPYKTTSISELGGNNNPMIGVISGWAPISSDPAGVVAAVKAAVRSAVPTPQPPAMPNDVQQLVDLGRVISDIRARRPLNPSQLTVALQTLASMPPELMGLLEPVPLLQAICREVVLTIIEFSKPGPGMKARQRKILLKAITELKSQVKPRKIRDEMVNNPIGC
jgi:hypothetical protein